MREGSWVEGRRVKCQGCPNEATGRWKDEFLKKQTKDAENKKTKLRVVLDLQLVA